jgi:hypothetical protein
MGRRRLRLVCGRKYETRFIGYGGYCSKNCQKAAQKIEFICEYARRPRQGAQVHEPAVGQARDADSGCRRSTAGMVGDLQGIAGKAMPEIPSIDMPLLERSDAAE